MELFFVWLVCMFVGAALLSRFNRAGTGFLLGLVFGPLGVIVAAVMRSNYASDESGKRHSEQLEAIARAQQPVSANQTRDEVECPFCAEKVLRKAVVCKHCGRDIPPS